MTSKNDLTLLPALPPGWVAVPEEPTQEMIAAGRHEAAFVFDAGSFEIVATSAYRAMLATRPALSTESGWRDIATAPKEPDEHDLTPTILLGFAPDEEGHSLATREGYWRQTNLPGWVTSIDPNVPTPYIQPTHWMPLPTPPTETER